MTMLEVAQHLALDLGWPVLPIRPHGKEPLTSHGVRDATTDERRILHYLERWPDCNLAVATGSPGPTVLDIDRPDEAAFHLAAILRVEHPPEVTTARGVHLYFRGEDRGTVSLGYGELRGRGSYVVVPPSIHPDGVPYQWTVEPNGPLPTVPAQLGVSRTAGGAGTGDMPIRDRVSHGHRHDHLKDLALRLVRSGIVDEATLARALQAEFDSVCDPDPPIRPTEFSALASWAAQTRIAGRERARLQRRQTQGPGALLEHRRLVDEAGGWAPLTLASVKRYGNRLSDALHIYLDNGALIDFPRQGDITGRGHWRRTVIAGSDADADPPKLSDEQLLALYRSLCVLAGKSHAQFEADEHADLLGDLLALCTPLTGYTATDSAGRYALVAAVKAARAWDPADRGTLVQPLLIADQVTGIEYLRAGDVMAYYRFRGAGISTREFPGRMAMVGLEHVRLNGREPSSASAMGDRRRTNTALFYRLGEAPDLNESEE